MPLSKPKESIDPLAKRAWRIRGTIITGIELLLLGAYFVVRILWLDLPLFIGVIFAVVILILAVVQVVILPAVKMIYWGYEINDNEIDIQHGIIIIKRTLIPMVRIQHVDTEHGPILRMFNLATLSVSTAGTVHKIPALKQETAEALRRQISHLAALNEEDV